MNLRVYLAINADEPALKGSVGVWQRNVHRHSMFRQINHFYLNYVLRSVSFAFRSYG